MRFLRHLLLLVALVFGLVGSADAQAAEWVSAPTPVEEVAPPPVPAGWIAVEGPFLVVHGRPEDRRQLTRLARHGAASLPRLAEELGLPLGTTIHVALPTEQLQFSQMQPGAPPHWADGTAWPLNGWIYLRHPRLRPLGATPLETVLDHELVHVLMGRAFAPNRAPRWLDEGTAQVFAGELTPDTTRRLARGLIGRDLYTLQELDWGFPRDRAGAQLAYAQSADFVAFFRAEYGDEAFHTLLLQLAAGAEIQGAVRTSTGLFLEDVDQAWRSRLSRPRLILSALGAVDAMWFFTGVLGFFGVIVIHIRQRRKRRRIVEEERLEEALVAALRGKQGPRSPARPYVRFRPDLDGY